ncbi:MAG: hypothetical protein AB8U77_07755, partial [Rickettsia conorii subsp. raoultii]|uniref:hypothetical protein n=2 Tax=Rickettsia conorii TaxID=781 RepID=UPI0029CABDE9
SFLHITPQAAGNIPKRDLIINYNNISHIPCTFNGQLYTAIRSFERNNEHYFVIVNSSSLEVNIVAQHLCSYRKHDDDGRYFSFKEVKSSNYYKALYLFNKIQDSNENQGLRNIVGTQGCFLSIDLCPSNKKLEYDLFNKILQASQDNHQINLLIAISGLWIVTHPEDFRWLQSLQTHNIKITWVNHSFSHIFYNDRDMIGNFLLLPNTNIDHEILSTEKLLIDNGELPSPFFRFPGLVSNKKILDILTFYGLIQLGASAWIYKLSKNDTVHNGDIILIHGNGNENKLALNTLMQLVQSNKFIWKNL